MLMRLKDGSYEWIEASDQFVRLVKQNLGEDAAHYASEIAEQSDYNNVKVSTDLDSYEATCEEQKSAADDMNDYVEQMIDYISTHKRLNRCKLNEMLTAAHKKWYDNF